MKMFKMIITLTAFAAMIATSARNLSAQEYRTDAGGYGYEQSRRVPSLAPAIALGTIAIVAVIAVAIQNSSHHDHGHDHSSSSSSE